jgi:uncharacterized membrane protein YqjE
VNDSTPSPPGLLTLLRRVLDTGLGTIQNRVELIGIELQEEKLRLVELLLWSAAVVFMAVLGVAVLTVAVAFLVGDSARPYVLIGAGVLYLAGAALAMIRLRARFKNGPLPLSETASQLKKDREWLASLIEK